MPRPLICRRVGHRPQAVIFKPAGIPRSEIEEVILTLDELEALRLADLEGLYHEEAAGKMGISRQTFGNIVQTARRKTADVLVNGRALKIQGGVVQMMEKHFICEGCKYEWSVPFGTGRPRSCPECQGTNLHRSPGERGWGRGAGRGCFRGGLRP